MDVILMRHGPAEDPAVFAATGRPDTERPLTEDGRRKVRAAAAGLARLVESPVRIISSPLVRARETADLVAEACGGNVRTVVALAPGGKRDRAMAGFVTSATVIAVGHEPDLGMLLGWLITGRPEPWHEFKKGGAACVAFDRRPVAGTGVIRWILPPKALRALGRR